MLRKCVNYPRMSITFCSPGLWRTVRPTQISQSLPTCTVPPISTRAAATDAYYSSKRWEIDLTRNTVTQKSSLSNHWLPVHCLSAFGQLKDHRKIWSAPGSWAAVKRWRKCEPLCHSHRSLFSFLSYVRAALSAQPRIIPSHLQSVTLNWDNIQYVTFGFLGFILHQHTFLEEMLIYLQD